MSDETMSDDDVVYRVPVYLSQDLASSLYLAQYPLRPAERPYDTDLGTLAEARIKPEHKKLELVYRLDAASDNFNGDAENLTHAIRLGSRTVPPKTNYAIGMIRESADGVQLHLTPLHAVVQMRPELAHIDAADAQRRQEEAAAKESGETEEPAQAVKPISVQYRKVDSERVADIKRSSFAHLQDKVDREKWVNLRVTPKSSPEAQNTFESLISSSAESVPFTHTLSELMDICNPPVFNPYAEISRISRATAALVTHDKLLTLDIDKQLSILLTNCPVIHFSQVCDLNSVDNVENSRKYVEALFKIAYCVQGCWVLKSHIYHTSQVELARDWLLTTFAKKRSVSRQQFADSTRLPAETAEVLLEELAVHNKESQMWEFKLPTDTAFMHMHPDVVAQQSALLLQLEQHVIDQLTALRLSFRAESSTGASANTELTPALVETYLIQFVDLLFQKSGVGVCGLPYLLRCIAAKRRVSERSSWLHLVTDSAVETLVRQRYFEIRPALFVRRDLNNPLVDRFRSVLVQHFAAADKAAIKKPEVFALWAIAVPDAAPSEADYNRIMKELCVYTGGAWALKSGDYEE